MFVFASYNIFILFYNTMTHVLHMDKLQSDQFYMSKLRMDFDTRFDIVTNSTDIFLSCYGFLVKI